MTPSVGNKYRTDLSNATDQGHNEVNCTENSSNKNYKKKIYFEYEIIPKIQKNSGKSLLVLINPLKYILVGLTL